jgi:hypothetical protein
MASSPESATATCLRVVLRIVVLLASATLAGLTRRARLAKLGELVYRRRTASDDVGHR